MKIIIGKIVNTHGVKGELRIRSDFKSNFTIYIGEDQIEETINTYRPHKTFDMIFLKGYNDINEVLKYKGKLVFVEKEDLLLKESDYLDEELLEKEVYLNEKLLGNVKELYYTKANLILVLEDESQIPLVKELVDITKDKIIIKEESIIVKNWYPNSFS